MTNTMLGLLAAIVLIPILAEASRGVVDDKASKPLAMQAGFGGTGALGSGGTIGSPGSSVGSGVGVAVCGGAKFAGSMAKSKLTGASASSESVRAAAATSASA